MRDRAPEGPVLAIDIGGTKLAAALVMPDVGHVVSERRCPTPAGRDAVGTFAPLAQAITGLVSDLRAGRVAGLPAGSQPTAIGIATAGPLDLPRHISPINIPAWREFDVVAAVERAVRDAGQDPQGIPCRLLGDAQAMAYGEYAYGAGRDLTSMIGVVVSTGIGAAVVADGRLVTGPRGNAGNLGHTSVRFDGPPCWCGGHGCVEWYASGPSMVRRARRAGWRDGDTAHEGPPDMVALAADAEHRDPIALWAIDEGMRALAAGLAALAATSDVTDIVVGGGVSAAGDTVLAPLRRHLADFSGLGHIRDLAVHRGGLPGAGLLGASASAAT